VIVLGIESSCDETAAALVRVERCAPATRPTQPAEPAGDGLVLADVVASQVALHAPFGGVVPELASRAHMRAIVPVVREALRALPGGIRDVDVIAATQGPGLVGALLVGFELAKALAFAHAKPLVGVNHLDGHLLASFLRREGTPPPPSFPFVALLASGGHTALYRVDAPGETALLGQTRDDAAGEAYDKAAKLLGLGYPGGPVVDRLAAKGDPEAVPFTVPMAGRPGLDFSFAGLKTAVARHVAEHGVPSEERALADLCASFQRAVVESLVRRSVAACTAEGVRDLVLTGGVAANRGLRARAEARCRELELRLHVPPMASCTDNAAMIAYAGGQRFLREGTSSTERGVYSRDPARRRGRFRADGTLIPRK
jgi:N6-L-threonylcarbamoyladenine synthase